MANLKEIKKIKDLDKEVKASGFNNLKDMDYISEYINIQRQNEEKEQNENIEKFELGSSDEELDEYFLQEGVTTDPKLIFKKNDLDEINKKLETNTGENKEDSLKDEEEIDEGENTVKERKGKKIKMKEEKYIKKAIKTKFKRKKKIPYNRNRNKAKGKLLKTLGL